MLRFSLFSSESQAAHWWTDITSRPCLALPFFFFVFSFYFPQNSKHWTLPHSVNPSLFSVFDARRLLGILLGTLGTLHLLIPAQPCRCCAAILVLFSAADKTARFVLFPCQAPPSPPSIIHHHIPTSWEDPHSTRLCAGEYHKLVRLSDGLLPFLSAKNHALWSHVFKANYPIRPLHLGFFKQQPHHPPPFSGHRNSFRGKRHSIQCIGSFALQPTTIN